MGPGWATIGRSSVSNGVPAVNGVDEDRLHLSIWSRRIVRRRSLGIWRFLRWSVVF